MVKATMGRLIQYLLLEDTRDKLVLLNVLIRMPGLKSSEMEAPETVSLMGQESQKIC